MLPGEHRAAALQLEDEVTEIPAPASHHPDTLTPTGSTTPPDATRHLAGKDRVYARAENRGLSLTTIPQFDLTAWVKDLQRAHGAPGVPGLRG
jgi:hypothetical protein